MSISEATGEAIAAGPGEGLHGIAREYVEQVTTAGDRFLRWERECILKREPSPKERQQHCATLKWLLRLTRLIHSMVADPDYPEPSARERLELQVWCLEQSWKIIYEPMPEAEANQLLAKIFPNESGA